MGKRISAIILGFLLLVGRISVFPEKFTVHNIEAIIEEAYKNCFRNLLIDGVVMQLRIPFAQNRERFRSQEIFYGGKGDPQILWPEIIRLLDDDDFRKYSDINQAEGLKLIIFDLRLRKWVPIINEINVRKLAEIPYPGSREMVFIFKEDSKLTIEDIYNYMYSVGSIGLDCSGFVYYIQKSITEALGTDLDEVLAIRMKRKAEFVSNGVGLLLYSTWPDEWETVDDSIINLRPGDIFLFRGRNRKFRHSAVIQSIDLEKGEISYIQCTDWAPQNARGVHKSHIYFNPDHPETSLFDVSVEWTQEVYPTFIGEPGLQFWINDGDRYRSYREYGGSIIVRSRFIKNLIEENIPGFYPVLPEN